MKKQPNILVVVVDSARADHLPCYGYERETAPNISRIAREGCVFDSAISAAPFSPASYASIISNLHPHQHGVNGDTVRIWPDAWRRLPEKLKERGYETFCVSNNSFVSEETNGAKGFDTFVGPQEGWLLRWHSRLYGRVRKYLGESAARKFDRKSILALDKGESGRTMHTVKDLVESSGKPFFGFVILMDPHAMYNPKRLEFCGKNRHVREFLNRINGRQMFARLMANGEQLSPSQMQIANDLYDAEIKHADRWVGFLVDWLRSTNRLDDTVLMICADHGEGFGEQDVWGHGFSLSDFMTRVPLIVRYPKLWKAGTRSQALVPLHAIHDTCLDVSTISDGSPEDCPNSLVQATDSDWHGLEYAFSEFPVQTGTLKMFKNINPDFEPGRWGGDMAAVRSRDWRYVNYETGEPELFDLRNDPAEIVSVADRHPDVARELAARLDAHMHDKPYQIEGDGGSVNEKIDESVLERLRALGYID